MLQQNKKKLSSLYCIKKVQLFVSIIQTKIGIISKTRLSPKITYYTILYYYIYSVILAKYPHIHI